MKKILWLLTMMVGTLTAQAGEYTYLTFETTDGAKASVSVEGLTLSISGTGNRKLTLWRELDEYPVFAPAGAVLPLSDDLRADRNATHLLF